MKQKTALVAALMNDPEIIIMDEPTTGLDPLMRESFLKIIKEEHKKGKTIFMSTHMYEEVEETCDRVALIDNGHIIDFVSLDSIANPEVQIFTIEFEKTDDVNDFLGNGSFESHRCDENNPLLIETEVKRGEVPKLLDFLSQFKIKSINENHDTLQEYFKRKFKEGEHEIL